ncbi:hypothetical protein [Streptomyces sp. SS]|uniref:hypothetical protein n=1 Tax=Streptomyces sp. SS TaxID=260742 RepID=UPI00036E9C83|nr:hypothetical protein [Streptomyces sp. SS]
MATALGGATLAVATVAPTAAQAATGNMRITKVVVNGGKDIVLTTSAKPVTVTATISEDSAVTEVWLELENRVGSDLNFHAARRATCTAAGSVKTCTTTLTLDPRGDMIHNGLVGSRNWQAYVQAAARDGDYASGYYPSVGLRRATALTLDAGPEPVRKGATLTATGRLTVANWNSNTWTSFANQPVQLQFCKSPCTAYTTVKTVTSTSTGSLRTTLAATSDGFWRWQYPAPFWASTSTSAPDYVDVR